MASNNRRGGKGDWIERANFVQDPAEYFSSRGGKNKTKRNPAKKHDRSLRRMINRKTAPAERQAPCESRSRVCVARPNTL